MRPEGAEMDHSGNGNAPSASPGIVLVTGATGYVGGRLVPRLLASGRHVRVLVRDPRRLQGRDWLGLVEVAAVDLVRPEGLDEALRGVDVAYYLVHSMARGAGYGARDLAAARSFAAAAAAAGVRRIIYLGGLGDPRRDLSQHLRSRLETGEALRSAGVPVTEFRAAIVVGSGSISFEMIRYLTERLPVMICPRWVYTRVQPIGIDDLLRYLAAALDTPASAGRVVEIGGADVLTYGAMMLGYARARGLRRRLQPVPVLTPALSSYWVHLVTPIPSTMARPLIEGLRSETIVRDMSARELFPEIHPVDYQAAVRAALSAVRTGEVESSWCDGLCTSERGPVTTLSSREGMLVERRQRLVPAAPATVFAVCVRLGGRGAATATPTGRGGCAALLDRLVGGVGLQRGRRTAATLRVGDALDFWRVEAVDPGRLLRLRAEMKLPGEAWLQFETLPDARGTLLVQTAFFAPKGLAGLAYWYLLAPVHKAIFSGMIAALAAEAGRSGARRGTSRLPVSSGRYPDEARAASTTSLGGGRGCLSRSSPPRTTVPTRIRSRWFTDFFVTAVAVPRLPRVLPGRRRLAGRAPTGSSRTRDGASRTDRDRRLRGRRTRVRPPRPVRLRDRPPVGVHRRPPRARARRADRWSNA